MRIGVVTDSACDLPKDFLDKHKIAILPITIRVGDRHLVDERNPEDTLDFYRSDLWKKDHDAESVPYSVEQIKETFLQRLVLDFDYVFCITVTGRRSPIYANATKASYEILNGYKEVRRKAGVEGPFALRVIDSEAVFAGQGVVVAEAIRKISEGTSISDIRNHVTGLLPNVYGYMVPDDLYYLRSRARKKGDSSVSFIQYALGSALNIKPVIRAYANDTQIVGKGRGFDKTTEQLFENTIEQVEKGLKAPTVVVSYGGDPDRVRSMPGYEQLEKVTRENGVDLHLTFMSTTAGVNVGAGALAVGFAAAEHDIQLG